MPRFKVWVTETEVKTSFYIVDVDDEAEFHTMLVSDLGEPVDEDSEPLHDPEITYWEEL